MPLPPLGVAASVAAAVVVDVAADADVAALVLLEAMAIDELDVNVGDVMPEPVDAFDADVADEPLAPLLSFSSRCLRNEKNGFAARRRRRKTRAM